MTQVSLSRINEIKSQKIGQIFRMSAAETPDRIEPARIEEPKVELVDVVADLTAVTSYLGRALHPRTAANLAGLVRVMNTYYSNLIEGNNTRPRDIERALLGEFDEDEGRRNLQLEAVAHVRVQSEIDRKFLAGELPSSTSTDFICWVHQEFYRDAPTAMLYLKSADREVIMEPGKWRTKVEHDNVVGRHIPPSSEHVAAFMEYFQRRYDLASLGRAGRIMAIPAAHHRFNYITRFQMETGGSAA